MLCGIPARAAELEPAYVRTVFDQTNGLPTDEANAVLQTRDGYLWVGSYGGLLRFDGSEFHNFSTEGAIATPSILCIAQAPDGTLLAHAGEEEQVVCASIDAAFVRRMRETIPVFQDRVPELY